MSHAIRPLTRLLAGCVAGVTMGFAGAAGATVITLGDQDFASGSILVGGIAEFTGAQGGEPPPFGLFVGGDLPGPTQGNFSGAWTFNLVPGAIASASIAFGIYDYDSAASGNQLASFSVDGVDLTLALNALFEAPGIGEQSQYDIFMLTLPAGVLAALADGVATFSLSLQGPALCTITVVPPVSGDCTPNVGNGAGLDFSTLTFNEAPPPNGAPEPATLALFLTGLAGIALSRRRPRFRATRG
jgi:PEP-CTERM motif